MTASASWTDFGETTIPIWHCHVTYRTRLQLASEYLPMAISLTARSRKLDGVFLSDRRYAYPEQQRYHSLNNPLRTYK